MTVQKTGCPLPPIDTAEVLRYAGVRALTPQMQPLLTACLAACAGVDSGRVCYLRLPVAVEGEMVDLTFARVRSTALARTLRTCREAVCFAATVGVEMDRLIRRHSAQNMAAAVWMQAIGAERVEALCDAFCDGLAQEAAARGQYPRPRFSPGYGDLPLTLQTALFAALDCPRQIGLTLLPSLLMSPSKSVTAIVGLGAAPCRADSGCAACPRQDCAARRQLDGEPMGGRADGGQPDAAQGAARAPTGGQIATDPLPATGQPDTPENTNEEAVP